MGCRRSVKVAAGDGRMPVMCVPGTLLAVGWLAARLEMAARPRSPELGLGACR